MYALVVFTTLVASILSFTSSKNCTIHNFEEVSSVLQQCSEITVFNVTVPAGNTLEFNLKKNSVVTLEGTITFQFQAWKGPLLEFKGDGITVKGTKGSVIDGKGELYWDHLGDKGLTKPQLVNIVASNDSVFQNLHLRNCPNHCFYLRNSDNVTISEIDIDVSDGNKNNFTGHNTDGFNLGFVTNTIIKNCTVKNQDDCVSINAASNISIRNMDCSGGHGLSISVTRNPVDNVTYSDSIVRNSANGLHVKTHTNGGETVISNITYKNIKLEGITNFGINIQEDYKDGEGTGIPANNIKIVNLIISNISGTMNGKDSKPVQIICGDTGCANWQWSDIYIVGNSTPSYCNYAPSGFNC
ncbi:polygalacturonase [Leptinotarsa decemlineata]|uniref:polygalacturonase n=1 Tax=Leptinotarsa decemlineata TaxID=7539 RepID=UPI003D308265